MDRKVSAATANPEMTDSLVMRRSSFLVRAGTSVDVDEEDDNDDDLRCKTRGGGGGTFFSGSMVAIGLSVVRFVSVVSAEQRCSE